MNPHASVPASPCALIRSVWVHWQLIAQMVQREVVGRYRGSVMGLLWSFLNPLLMLAVYTFVFSVIFKARWAGVESESRAQFAIILFAGLIVHSLFAEVLNRAPALILANVNYVKKVVFPLEILSIVSLGSALFHALVSLFVLVATLLVVNGELHLTFLLMPLVLFPLVAFTLGLGWMLASLGVYLRDISQTIGIITTVMLFLSPVFYPVTALPEDLQPVMLANPLTFIIEQSREVLIWGRWPNWSGLAIYTAISLAVAWVGFAWFQKTRRGFADVL
jgi:lipopolysaccharide transport system permease protein